MSNGEMENNNTEKIEKIKQKNCEENRRNNTVLKQQLKNISTQIEEIFAQQENKKKNKLQNSMENSNKVDIKEFTNFKSKIDKYKKKIELNQKDINSNLEYENIIKNENEYKSIASRLLSLKKENEVLKKIIKRLNEQLKEEDGGVKMDEKASQMAQKLEYLKQEIVIMNSTSNMLKKQIKSQNTEIGELNKYIEKVKSNIDYAKEEQEKANKNGEMTDEQVIKKIKELTESIKQLEIEKEEQKINYNAGIKKQKKIKGLIEQDIKILKIKIQHTKQDNKINELKLKELKKIQDDLRKEKLRKEKEQKLKEEKRKKELLKRKKFLEFQNKFLNGLTNSDEEAGERNYYNNTTVDNYRLNSNINTQSHPNEKFSRYSNKNAPFNIKFNANTESRAHTQIGNDEYYSSNRYNNNKEKYEFDEEQGLNLSKKNKNINNKGKVIDEIDDLKKDIINALNEDEINIETSGNSGLLRRKRNILYHFR